MKVFVELERAFMREKTRHEDLREGWSDQNLALITRYREAAAELKRVFTVLSGGQQADSAETCPHCQSMRWRREGRSDIACAECGILAKGVAFD
jgi:hypothetical protein